VFPLPQAWLSVPPALPGRTHGKCFNVRKDKFGTEIRRGMKDHKVTFASKKSESGK